MADIPLGHCQAGRTPCRPAAQAGFATGEDGNGRIARAIADCALARADDCPQRFYSMSGQIERERKDYYTILEQTQRAGLDITLWLDWFLGCLGRAIDGADDTLAAVLHKARVWQQANQHPLNERQRGMINRLLDGFEGKLTSGKYAKLAKCSPDTALRDIRELMEYGLLQQGESGGRSTSYELLQRLDAHLFIVKEQVGSDGSH